MNSIPQLQQRSEGQSSFLQFPKQQTSTTNVLHRRTQRGIARKDSNSLDIATLQFSQDKLDLGEKTPLPSIAAQNLMVKVSNDPKKRLRRMQLKKNKSQIVFTQDLSCEQKEFIDKIKNQYQYKADVTLENVEMDTAGRFSQSTYEFKKSTKLLKNQQIRKPACNSLFVKAWQARLDLQKLVKHFKFMQRDEENAETVFKDIQLQKRNTKVDFQATTLPKQKRVNKSVQFVNRVAISAGKQQDITHHFPTPFGFKVEKLLDSGLIPFIEEMDKYPPVKDEQIDKVVFLQQDLTVSVMETLIQSIDQILERAQIDDPQHLAPMTIWNKDEKSSIYKINQFLSKTQIDFNVGYEKRKVPSGKVQDMSFHRSQIALKQRENSVRSKQVSADQVNEQTSSGSDSILTDEAEIDIFGVKKKKFLKPEERIQNLMEKLGIKQEYEEIKAQSHQVDSLIKSLPYSAQIQAKNLKKQILDLQRVQNIYKQENISQQMIQEDLRYLDEIQENYIQEINDMNKMPLFDVNKKLNEINKQENSTQPEGQDEVNKGKQKPKTAQQKLTNFIDFEKLDNGAGHKDVMNQFQQGLNEKYKVDPFKEFLNSSQLNTAQEKQKEQRVQGAVRLAKLMLKHDNKLNNSGPEGNQKNAMVHTEAVQEALSATYSGKQSKTMENYMNQIMRFHKLQEISENKYHQKSRLFEKQSKIHTHKKEVAMGKENLLQERLSVLYRPKSQQILGRMSVIGNIKISNEDDLKELETYEDTRDYHFDYAAHRELGFAKNQKEFTEQKRQQLLQQNSNKNKLMQNKQKFVSTIQRAGTLNRSLTISQKNAPSINQIRAKEALDRAQVDVKDNYKIKQANEHDRVISEIRHALVQLKSQQKIHKRSTNTDAPQKDQIKKAEKQSSITNSRKQTNIVLKSLEETILIHDQKIFGDKNEENSIKSDDDENEDGAPQNIGYLVEAKFPELKSIVEKYDLKQKIPTMNEENRYHRSLEDIKEENEKSFPLLRKENIKQNTSDMLMSKILEDENKRSEKLFTVQEAVDLFEIRKKEMQMINLIKKFKNMLNETNQQKVDDNYVDVTNINNKNKFIEFIRDSAFYIKNALGHNLPNEEVDKRKVCLCNRQIGPQQLYKILSLLDDKAKLDSNNKISSLDLCKNQIGDEGLKLIIDWLRVDGPNHHQDNNSDEDSQYSGECNNSGVESPDVPSEAETKSDIICKSQRDFADNSNPNIPISHQYFHHSHKKHDDGADSFKLFSEGTYQDNASEFGSTRAATQPNSYNASTIQNLTNLVKGGHHHKHYLFHSAVELVSLNLQQIGAKSRTFLKLFKVLQSNNSLIYLNISNKDGLFRNSNIQASLMIKGICPYLRNPNCLLNHLDLFGCQMGNKGFKRFSDAVIQNSNLISLNIGRNALSGTHSSELIVEIMDNCENIVDLNFSHNNLETSGIQIIITFIARANRNKLEILNMSYCGATQVLARVNLFGEFILNNNMKRLDFSGNQLKQNLSAIIQKIQEDREIASEMRTMKKQTSHHKEHQEQEENDNRKYEKKYTVDMAKKAKPVHQSGQDQSHHSSIQNSITKLRNLVFGRPSFQDLQLNNCEIGDFGFQTLIKGINQVKNSEQLTLGLSKNLLTNESINWLTDVYLFEKQFEHLHLHHNSRIVPDLPYETNNFKKLRIKKLDLSNNFLRTTQKVSFSNLFVNEKGIKDKDYFQGQVLIKFNPYLMECAMKKFFSRFNSQIFIESLDLSNNFELNEDLAQFVIKFYTQYNFMHDSNFNFMDDLGLEDTQDTKQLAQNQHQHKMVQNQDNYDNNKLKYEKNLLLTELSLRNCTINYHSLNVINYLLRKNKNFRIKQISALRKIEYTVLNICKPQLKAIQKQNYDRDVQLSNILAEHRERKFKLKQQKNESNKHLREYIELRDKQKEDLLDKNEQLGRYREIEKKIKSDSQIEAQEQVQQIAVQRVRNTKVKKQIYDLKKLMTGRTNEERESLRILQQEIAKWGITEERMKKRGKVIQELFDEKQRQSKSYDSNEGAATNRQAMLRSSIKVSPKRAVSNSNGGKRPKSQEKTTKEVATKSRSPFIKKVRDNSQVNLEFVDEFKTSARKTTNIKEFKLGEAKSPEKKTVKPKSRSPIHRSSKQIKPTTDKEFKLGEARLPEAKKSKSPRRQKPRSNTLKFKPFKLTNGGPKTGVLKTASEAATQLSPSRPPSSKARTRNSVRDIAPLTGLTGSKSSANINPNIENINTPAKISEIVKTAEQK